ncbi:MAG: ammonia channel protein [Myxococcales bacterium SG8_38_1]|jgi:Amt family ammonium transporter|nr:MAG: ammonia channel protein [Myxococcales bacterium SG8_38_1]
MEALNQADTAWLMVSCALVMLMTPGLALFYGGMVGSRNVLSSFMHSFIALGIITLQWVVIGYSLAFGSDAGGGFIGGMEFAFLNGVGLEPQEGSTIPHILFMAFQMMFAIITPALISGAIAERMKFSAYLIFIVLWATLVYDPICHWVWGPDGWLGARGALDFAGGTVVHLSSGAAALICALVIGRRSRPGPPHNLTLTLLGAGMLWFGWFGFNAGSALAANDNAALALVNTHVAAAAAAFAWALAEWIKQGKPTALGVASGLVAGLVVITPAAGFVGPMSAVLMGLIAGPVCYGAVMLKGKLGYDDALDAFGIHGVGGALGAVLTGVFAAAAWGGTDGLIAGNNDLFVENIIGVIAAASYSAIVTVVLLKVIDATVGLRVSGDEENEGLDTNLHGEEGYHMGGAGALSGSE